MDLVATARFGVPIFITGLLTYACMVYRIKLSDLGAQVSDHIKDLEKLQDSAIAFWMADGSKIPELRARLLAAHCLAIRIYPDIQEICRDRKDGYSRMMQDYL